MCETLEILYCKDYCCGVDQNGITELKKLRILKCSGNSKIFSVNHIGRTLEELYCKKGHGIHQEGISKLQKIKILCMSKYTDICDLNHMCDTLEKLFIEPYFHAKGNHIIKLSKLKLKILKCQDWNIDIDETSPLIYTLKELYCAEKENKVKQENILIFKNLEKLVCHNNSGILNVNHLAATLKELDCGYGCGINQNGISKLSNLEILRCPHNKKVCNVMHLADTIRVLDCRRSNLTFTQYQICQLKNMENIYFDGVIRTKKENDIREIVFSNFWSF